MEQGQTMEEALAVAQEGTCSVRAVHMQCTCSAHAVHMQGTCRAHAVYMQGTCRAHALCAAQAAGIAEADPEGDLSGMDAAVKVVALVNSLGMGGPLLLSDVAVEVRGRLASRMSRMSRMCAGLEPCAAC